MIDQPSVPFKTIRGSGGGSAQADGSSVLVRVASTANVASRSGTPTINGEALAVDDKVLLKDQTTAAQNGVYVVKSGAWSGPEQTEVVHVKAGTANGLLCFLLIDTNTYASARSGVALVRVASTANVASRSGLLTIDDITLADNEKVLLKNQSTSSQNGVYVVKSGTWTGPIQTEIVHVKEGTVGARLAFLLTSSNTYSGHCAVYGS